MVYRIVDFELNGQRYAKAEILKFNGKKASFLFFAKGLGKVCASRAIERIPVFFRKADV